MPSITFQKPNIVVKNGKPQAVILDIRAYEKLLETAQDRVDLDELKRIKKSEMSFRSLEHYLGKRGV